MARANVCSPHFIQDPDLRRAIEESERLQVASAVGQGYSQEACSRVNHGRAFLLRGLMYVRPNFVQDPDYRRAIKESERLQVASLLQPTFSQEVLCCARPGKRSCGLYRMSVNPGPVQERVYEYALRESEKLARDQVARPPTRRQATVSLVVDNHERRKYVWGMKVSLA
jgi:hypothetical protein